MFKILMGLLKRGNNQKIGCGKLSVGNTRSNKRKRTDPNELIQIQTKINELEAQHRSVFVAGWRPFCGWICSVALFYNFVIRDLFIWAIQPETVPPAIQMEHLMTILMGMLGLGGLRTYEKIKDKSK